MVKSSRVCKNDIIGDRQTIKFDDIKKVKDAALHAMFLQQSPDINISFQNA